MGRNSRVMHAQASAVLGWVTSWKEGHQGGEELQSSACSGLGSEVTGDLLGRGTQG